MNFLLKAIWMTDQKQFWGLKTFSLWRTKSKACNEPENKVFGQLPSLREREPSDSSWRILQLIQAVCGLGAEREYEVW
jgi:hypothetical protein